MDWAKIVKTIRKRKGYSKAELGRRLGVHRNIVWRWEFGKGGPSYKNGEKLMEMYKEVTE